MKTMTQDLAALVDKMPRLDKRGTMTGPNRIVAERVYDEILKGGAASIAGIVDLLHEVDDGTDWKARYVLHGMAHYLGGPDKSEPRAAYLKGLSSKIGSKTPKPIQGFVVRQLHVVGEASTLDTLGSALLDGDLYEDAAQAILAIGGGIEKFRAALPKSTGKARVCFVQALGVLRDKASASTLRKDAAGKGQIRLTAVWALATIGDPGAIDLSIEAADGAEGFDRIELTNSCFLLADRLKKAGENEGAKRIYTHLRDTRTSEDEKYIRDLAADALKS